MYCGHFDSADLLDRNTSKTLSGNGREKGEGKGGSKQKSNGQKIFTPVVMPQIPKIKLRKPWGERENRGRDS